MNRKWGCDGRSGNDRRPPGDGTCLLTLPCALAPGHDLWLLRLLSLSRSLLLGGGILKMLLARGIALDRPCRLLALLRRSLSGASRFLKR